MNLIHSCIKLWVMMQLTCLLMLWDLLCLCLDVKYTAHPCQLAQTTKKLSKMKLKTFWNYYLKSRLGSNTIYQIYDSIWNDNCGSMCIVGYMAQLFVHSEICDQSNFKWKSTMMLLYDTSHLSYFLWELWFHLLVSIIPPIIVYFWHWLQLFQNQIRWQFPISKPYLSAQFYLITKEFESSMCKFHFMSYTLIYL